MKLSVIIPIYNSEKYLARCLDSVLNQTFQDKEIICVDDGSTDHSLDILIQYQENHSNITVIQQENQHAGVARNHGLSVAKGEYVHFLDADDYLFPKAYEMPYKLAKSLDLDYVKTRNKSFDQRTGRKINSHYFDLEHVDKSFFGKCISMETHSKVFLRTARAPWSGIMKKNFLDEQGIRFNNLKCVNDRSFYADLITHSSKMALCDSYMVYYQVNNAESLVGVRGEHFECHFTSYQIVESKMADISDDIKRKILGEELADLAGWYARLNERQKEKHDNQIHQFFEEFDWKAIDESYLLNPIMHSLYKTLEIDYSDFIDVDYENYLLYNMDELEAYLEESNELAIYGAGKGAHFFINYLQKNGYDLSRIIGILVTDKKDNPDQIMGIPVYEKDSISLKKKDAIVIAAFNNTHLSILNELMDYGISRIKAIEDSLYEEMQNELSI